MKRGPSYGDGCTLVAVGAADCLSCAIVSPCGCSTNSDSGSSKDSKTNMKNVANRSLPHGEAADLIEQMTSPRVEDGSQALRC